MRLTRHRHSTRTELNMTPMIDVVFLLLIFFMTVSQVSEINKERLELPKQQGVEEQKPSLMIVNVTEQGDVFVGGQQVSVTQVAALAGEEVARQGNDPARVTIVLRADERGTSRVVNEVVTVLSRMQVSRIRIAVQEPQ